MDVAMSFLFSSNRLSRITARIRSVCTTEAFYILAREFNNCCGGRRNRYLCQMDFSLVGANDVYTVGL